MLVHFSDRLDMADARLVPVSVLVHCKNEETNLPYCLRSVTDWADQVIVIDSDSTDRTQEIARRYGATVLSRPCTRVGLVAQRNWALDSGPIRNGWVFVLDADEEMSRELRDEVADIVRRDPADRDGYWCRFMIIFGGRWIRRSSPYPTWSMRLFRHAVVRYEQREVNAHPRVAPGREGYLRAHFLTEDRRPFEAFVERMNEFSSLEAVAYAQVLSGARSPTTIRGRVFGTHAERRRWMKNVYVRLPFRGAAIFLYLYVFRLGFLDGFAGLDFALYKGVSEWLISAKARERLRRAGHDSVVSTDAVLAPFVRSEQDLR
ncbi:MAG: glycosyltransferase family 2 protein [Gemmatimonadaceae bacterium]|nr:glycosyltransferase family 2 protein [Gemmatimonadaceae bacterium]